MNFNHLISRVNGRVRCCCDKHHWLPTGMTESTQSGHFRVDFYCKHCYNRATEFLNEKTYGMHKKTFTKYTGVIE